MDLVGPAAGDLFPAPGRAVVLRALVDELSWAVEDDDWTYAALNAARAWCYAEESVMVSKLDGWLWVRPRVTGPVFLDQALTAYLAPRGGHRVPTPDVAGYQGWARGLVVHVQELLRAAVCELSSGPDR